MNIIKFSKSLEIKGCIVVDEKQGPTLLVNACMSCHGANNSNSLFTGCW